MSDFFTRLAQRTLGLVPVAKPIIAPMFAQGPNIPSDYSPWDNESQGKIAATPARKALPVFSQPDSDSMPLMQRAGQSSGQPFRPGSAPAPHRHPDSSSLDQVASKQVNFEDFEDRIAPGQGQNTSLRPEYLPDAQTNMPVPKIDSDQMTHNHVDLPDSKRSKENILGRNEPFEDFEDRIVPGQGQNTSLQSGYSPDAQGDVSIPDSGVMPGQPGKTHSLRVAAPESSSSTPTIQVTIGRIEVRAITPPVPPAPRHGPALSLDEYLKQRNGGKQ